MEWTNERVIDLIKLYEKHMVLWNSSDKYYKMLNKKNDAWKEISQELNIDVQEIKRKVNVLLATYRKARQKVAQNKKSGIGTDELYSPLFAFNHFHFLHDKYQPKETRNTEETSSQSPALEDVESGEERHTQEALKQPTVTNADEEIIAQETALQENNTGVTQQNTGRKQLRTNEDPRINESFQILKKISNKNRDEYDAYGEYIARKLRSFDKRTAAYVQKGCNDILFKAEIGEYPMERRGIENYTPDTLQTYWSTTSPSITETTPTIASPYQSPQQTNPDLSQLLTLPTPSTSQSQQTQNTSFTSWINSKQYENL